LTRQRYVGAIAALALQVFFANTAWTDESVLIENAWVRAMPPSQSSTAGYMSVRNRGQSGVKIMGADSGLAGRVEIHSSREVDGMVRMEQLESVAIDPGQVVQFAPGGMHLMIMDLEKMPAAGETLSLCLKFESGESACTEAEVRRAAPAADNKMHQHH